ncbi:MFS transporter [Orenia marismortui]|uniref:MFS transporter n=1 Tax=Orenia marismortui TaxID=46469 RepID=UPI0003624EFE|nr:MFS transporter [Orenia marismortui]
MKNNKVERFYLREVITVALLHLLHDIFGSFLSPVLPLLIDRFDLSYFQVSLLNIIRKLPSIFSLVIASFINNIDRRYINYLIIVAPMTMIILMSLLGVLSSYMMLLFLLFITGITSAIFHIFTPPIIKELSGDKVGRGISIYQLGGEAARSLGPLVILSVISVWGLEGSYRLISVGLVCALFFYSKIKNIKLDNIFNKEEGEEDKSSLFSLIEGHFSFILKIGIIRFFWSLIKISLTLFLPTYLKATKGVSLWLAGGALTIVQISGAIGTYLGGSISDKIGRSKMILISLICTSIAMLGFTLSSGIYLFIFLVILGFFIYSINPVILTLVQEADSKPIVIINGFYKTISFISTALATLIIGQGADLYGLNTMYRIMPLLLLISIPVILKLANKK